tara:strand:- start:664 stop:1023 length:360 start_codon:yes stop_codon:yes gene_type:complete
MSNKSTTFTKYDRNRFRKIYPVTRFPESLSFRSKAEVVIESNEISFNNEESKSGVLEGTYKSLPTISIGVSTNDPTGEQSNVNIFISSISLGGDGKVSFVMNASAPFTGTIALQVLSVL